MSKGSTVQVLIREMHEMVTQNRESITSIQKLLEQLMNGQLNFTINKSNGTGKNNKRVITPKKYKFTKDQDNIINEISGKKINLSKAGANRTKYLHFLYEMKTESHIMKEYNQLIDKHVNDTMRIHDASLSEAKEILGMKTKNTTKNDGVKWEERTIDMYIYDNENKKMIPIMAGPKSEKKKKMNLTAFIGKRWTEHKVMSNIPKTDIRYNKQLAKINKSKNIIKHYEDKKLKTCKKVDDIMAVVKRKMKPGEFRRHFPAWAPQQNNATPRTINKQMIKVKQRKPSKSSDKKQKSSYESKEDEILDGYEDNDEEITDDDENVLNSVALDEVDKLHEEDEDALSNDLFDDL